MGLEISENQQRRVEKIQRLREYFKNDRPETYEWTPSDERLDFKLMSDAEVSAYLKKEEAGNPG